MGPWFGHCCKAEQGLSGVSGTEKRRDKLHRADGPTEHPLMSSDSSAV